MNLRSILIAGATLAAMGSAAVAADSKLTVFDWSGFNQKNIVADYVKKYGDLPTYAFFGDDDEAFQKVSSGFQVDLTHPCSQMVQKYRDAGLIVPWDTSKIPNFKNIGKRFLDSKVFVDNGTVWYIPTDYAYTATLYNADKVPAADASTLQIFVDPKYKGHTSLPDNSDDVWALGLLATGVTNWTHVTDAQFKAAADWLRKAHKNVVSYWSDPSNLNQLMDSGQVTVAWSWNDSATQLKAAGKHVVFNRTPKEGASSWFCGWVHMKNAPGDQQRAYDFINAFLAPSAARGLLEDFGYASANDAGEALIPHEELVKHDIDPVKGTLLAQTPLDQKLRDRMVAEFQKIKAGF
ncbi:MAG: extracellular solute-binding protein [Paracoccaceae bacterium]|nr:extracellular solute-binding protein [Paracoccaceae bacterium]MDE3122265.1 extracellular solute-binding protein [Paracoccaceae bacterium]MDE3240774.1 extracellular solute-binding protein [Paracoccaceae bacterium]